MFDINIDYRENAKWTIYIHIVSKEISGYDIDKYYVGITSQNLKTRWRKGLGYSRNEHFFRAINKYGWDNIQHEIFAEHLTKNEACTMEKILIQKLKSNDYHYGYNMSSGGESGKAGVPTSELQKKVTSERLKELWKNPEYREKMINISRAKANKNKQKEKKKKKWEDPEYKKMHSGINSPMYGRKGESLYGADNHNAKKVVCLNTKEVFDCIKDAKEKMHTTYVGECCHQKRDFAGKDQNGIKLVWRFYDDYIKLTDEEINKIIIDANSPITRIVVNLTTNQLFRSAKSAADLYNIKNPCCIGEACRNGKKIKKCYWQYFDDYLKENNLSKEEAMSKLDLEMFNLKI